MLQYLVSIPSTVEEVKLISSYFIHALFLLSLLSHSVNCSIFLSHLSPLAQSLRKSLSAGFDCDYGLNGYDGFIVKGCWRGGKLKWVWVVVLAMGF
jgi:hypothetical protein